MTLIQPLLTEKTYKQAADLNGFTFKVGADADKKNIAKAVAAKFSVEVEKVRIVNQLGKIKNFGARRQAGCRSNYKKAIVTLKKGQKIDLFDMK